MSKQELLDAIEAYRVKNGWTEATVSKKLFGSGDRLANIKAGAGITMRTYDRLWGIVGGA